MATYVEITPDPFGQSFDKQNTERTGRTKASPSNPGLVNISQRAKVPVRRPVRGIQLKQDTYATIQVRTSDGRNLPLIDAAGTQFPTQGGGFTTHYSNFLINSVAEQRMEKSQIVQTFGEPYIFFFGEQPRFIQVQGILLNTADFNWRAEFWENYDKYMRGTRCVQTKTRVYLSWDDIVVEGYVTQADAQDASEQRNFVQFSFQMFLTNYQNISNIGSPTGHLDGKAISLDANGVFGVDTVNRLDTGATSTTVAVRRQNALSFNSKASLLDAVRNAQIAGSIAGGTMRLVQDPSGAVVDFFSVAMNLLGTRNLRVPSGFTGESVFSDLQFAQGSIDPATLVDGGTGFQLQTTIAGRPFFIQGTLGLKSQTARFGPLSLNKDEFVNQPENTQHLDLFDDLVRKRFIEDQQAINRVRDMFRSFGVDTEPPSDVLRLINQSKFGTVPLEQTAAIASIQAQSALTALNVLPQPLPRL
jgi:hypothetical protein